MESCIFLFYVQVILANLLASLLKAKNVLLGKDPPPLLPPPPKHSWPKMQFPVPPLLPSLLLTHTALSLCWTCWTVFVCCWSCHVSFSICCPDMYGCCLHCSVLLSLCVLSSLFVMEFIVWCCLHDLCSQTMMWDHFCVCVCVCFNICCLLFYTWSCQHCYMSINLVFCLCCGICRVLRNILIAFCFTLGVVGTVVCPWIWCSVFVVESVERLEHLKCPWLDWLWLLILGCSTIWVVLSWLPLSGWNCWWRK